MLRDLFEDVILWDVKTERARVEPAGTDSYIVAVDVVAKKVRADSTGKETEVPMDELVDVGVFAPGGEQGLGTPLSLSRYRVRSGKQTIRVTVRQKPGRAGIDPLRRLIDRKGDDNVVEVESGATAAPGAHASPRER
jgi:hypothetical protein